MPMPPLSTSDRPPDATQNLSIEIDSGPRPAAPLDPPLAAMDRRFSAEAAASRRTPVREQGRARGRLVRLVLNQGDDHAVQVEEEEHEVEAELGEGFLGSSVSAVLSDLGPALGLAHLLVDVELAEDLGGIQEMRVVDYPAAGQRRCLLLFPPIRIDLLLGVPSEQRQVEDQGDPVSVDKEQECQEPVDGDFRDDVRVEAVAEVNRVDVVAVRRQPVSTGRGEKKGAAAWP